jgi:hypothetical protein
VASALSLNMDGNDWFASGTGTFTAGSRLISGTYQNVGINNLITGNGNFSGFFTVPRIAGGTVAGAALAYNLTSNPADLGVVSGVLALQQGQGNALTPPALQQRQIAVLVPEPAVDFPYVEMTPAGGYALNGNFELTRLTAPAIDGNPVEFGLIDIGTSTIVESQASPLTMMQWGRWAGGNATFTGVITGTAGAIDLSQASLHWIESADSAKAPTIPTTGAVSYTLLGSTAPTDRAGHVGVLNNATFDADFTNQLVATSVDLTVNNLNWVASGVGVMGAQAGLPRHQFAGSFNQGIINPIQGAVNGTFAGFFTAPGATDPTVPGGAGLTYSLRDGQGLNVVDGAVVFKGP